MNTPSVVLITGASTGFGRTTAELLARRGHTVFATMRDPAGKNAPAAQSLQTLARAENLPLHDLPLDVTDEPSIQFAVDQALATAGRLDAVINNAGVGAIGATEAYTAEEFQALFNVNVFGVVRVNRAVLPAMRRQRHGLLIHVSSGAGRIAIPCMAAYCASKFALEAIADTYRFELAPFGIDSVLVEPGAHRTPILEKFAEPSDAARVAAYGPAAQYAQKIRDRFDLVAANPDSPGPEIVAQAFLDLIEMAPGTRPFRTVPTLGLQPVLADYNAMADQMRHNTAQRYNVPELLDLAKKQ
jgi:NAD(P)-dependent dehydrogenase (short-subunit alcohol dehydrogenase family)